MSSAAAPAKALSLTPRIPLLLAFNGVDAGKMRETLWSKYAILTAYMPHEEYSGLRVTPNVYSTLRDIDTFSEAVETELKNG